MRNDSSAEPLFFLNRGSWNSSDVSVDYKLEVKEQELMTIRQPRINFGDRILKALKKKRGLRLPSEAYEKYGPYVYAAAQKECFWRALVRTKDADLPDGYVDYFSFERGIQGHDSLGE